jgi:hypothetical protein
LQGSELTGIDKKKGGATAQSEAPAYIMSLPLGSAQFFMAFLILGAIELFEETGVPEDATFH